MRFYVLYSRALDIPFKTMIKPTFKLNIFLHDKVGYTIQNNDKTNHFHFDNITRAVGYTIQNNDKTNR